MTKTVLDWVKQRQTERRKQEVALHPNRNYRGEIPLPPNTAPPELAEEAGPDVGLPLALAALVDRPFLETERYAEQQRRAIREGAHPKVLKFTDAMVRRCKRVGIPMFAHCIVRGAAHQAELFRTGMSKDSPDDGLWPHRGCAVDLIHSVKGWNLNKEEWRLIGHLGKEVSDQMGLGMEWGGDWKFYDPAHWQFRKWRTVAGEYPWPMVK
ncbi:hypothetical protein [Tortoise microvirus 74]|nr:hypothetical protein [Tortoise microvirus 74]